MVACHEPRQSQWASGSGFIPAFVCYLASSVTSAATSGKRRSIVREQKSRGMTGFWNRCKCHAAGLLYLGSAPGTSPRGGSRRRNIYPQRFYVTPHVAVHHVYQVICSTTAPFIPMSVPHPNATGFLFHEKPDAQLVSRSKIQEIANATSGSGSSVEAAGAPRDLSRAQHPVSAPQNLRSKPRCAPYCISTQVIILASDHSIPRVIFQSTVWIVLIILVPLLAVAFYRDVEAEFQDHLDGQ